jgi:plasmid maintenance system antidote protein VapI
LFWFDGGNYTPSGVLCQHQLEIIFMKKVFASRLLSLCNGKSIAECARSWGIKQASLDRYVKEQRTPTGDAVVEICKATGASADWLLGLTDAASVPLAAAKVKQADESVTYWRDLAMSQQTTIAQLVAQLAEGRASVAAPAKTGGRIVTKTAS